jgi:hypothetical protein
MEVSDQLHAPAALLAEKNAGAHGIGDWVDPRNDLRNLYNRKNLLRCQAFETRTV